MFEKNLALVPLFDIYGKLLSDEKQQMFEMYYGDDLSLSEIAEETGMSRQGVRDCLKKCENRLLFFEEKLGFSEKIKAVEFAADKLKEIEVSRNDRETLEKIIAALETASE